MIPNDPDDDYSGYTFRAVVKNEFNPFSGQNDGVHFSAFDLFLKRLAEFIQTREGGALVEMTEDCRLEFFRWNAKGDVGIRAQITKYEFSTNSTRKPKTSLIVEFQVDGEFVNQLYENFKTEGGLLRRCWSTAGPFSFRSRRGRV
jgi:hypothetical protein